MNRNRQEKGITLIALVITIIVLLILAIVSIRAIQQGGIIGKSQNAVNSYEDKRIEEENRLNEYENKIDQYSKSDSENIEYYVIEDRGVKKIFALDYNNKQAIFYMDDNNGNLKKQATKNIETIQKNTTERTCILDGELTTMPLDATMIIYEGETEDGATYVINGKLYIDPTWYEDSTTDNNIGMVLDKNFDTSKLID